MAIRKTILATQIALALAIVHTNSYAGDVEISLPAATDAFTIDQPAGTELIRVQGNGNVGIGTTNPNYALHVNGIAEIDNTHGSVYLKRTEPYTSVGHGNGVITGMSPNSKHLGNFGYLNTTTDPDDPQGRFFIQTDTNTNQINETTEHHFNITHAGNIGIGTTDPSDGTANGGQALKLDVEGAIGASTYCDENGENCQTILQLAGGGGGGKFVDGTDPNNAVYTTGNVGINTTTPDSELHVVGSAKVIGNAGTNGLIISNATDGIQLKTYAGAEDTARFTSTGAAGDIMSMNLNSGNVGLGTTSPNAKLEVFDGEIRSTRDVNGTQYVRISGGDANKTGTYIGAHASESNKKVLEFLSVHDESGSAAGFNGFLFKVGGESAPQSVMAIREDQVGIGTTTPSGKLDVQDSNGRLGLFDGSTFVSRNSGNTLVVRNSDTSGGNLGQIILERGDGSGNDMALTTLYDNNNGVDSLGISSGSNMLMSIIKNGNVGIGTINPSDGIANGGQALKLDVEGAVGATSYCDERGENCQTILQLASGGGADNLGNHTATQNIDLAANKLVGNGGSEGIAIDANGNIGINTTTPTVAKLVVDGVDQAIAATGHATPIISTQSTGDIISFMLSHDPLNYGALGVSSNHDLGIWAGQMERVRVAANGNVGIATQTPSSMLEILGLGSSDHGLLKASDAADNDEIILDPNFGVTQNRTNAYFNNALVGGTISLRVSDAAARDTVALTAASNGNVGIGTSSPRGGLDIANDAAIPLIVERTSTLGGGFVWQDFMADGNHQWRINGDSSNGGGTANLKFSTVSDNGATVKPRFVLDPSGRIGINELTPTATLHVGATGGIRFEGLAHDATGHYLCHDSATGLVTHGASCAASDERLKKDITPVTNALEKITKLQGVNYHWKDENRGTRMELGLVAQTVENIIPEVVDTASDDMGTKSIRYENLVALLIEGMKEQQAQIDAQQKRIETLETAIK
jgi:hypothetical protein